MSMFYQGKTQSFSSLASLESMQYLPNEDINRVKNHNWLYKLSLDSI